MRGFRITPETFNEVKNYVRWHTNKRTSDKFKLHISTVINIRGSQTYAQYRQLVKAEHPPTKYSLADDIYQLHSLTFNKHDNKYIQPKTAKSAIQELLLS